MNQQPTSQTSLSGKFRDELNELRLHSRSFATCVRMEYEAVEQAIYDGVPLDLIAQKLAEVYGVQGTLSAFKSALSRIRKSIDGDVCKRWLNEKAPLPTAPGGASGNGVPLFDPVMQANLGVRPTGAHFDNQAGAQGIPPPYVDQGAMPVPLPFGAQPLFGSQAAFGAQQPFGTRPPYGMQAGDMQYLHTSVPMFSIGGYQRSI
jgi:hypothetical protein